MHEQEHSSASVGFGDPSEDVIRWSELGSVRLASEINENLKSPGFWSR